MKSRSRFQAISIAIASIAVVRFALGAGAIEQLKVISKLPPLDLQKLERGDIVGNRGPLGSFTRGVYAESCYFIHAPMAMVGEQLLHWNSAKHPELEISMRREYRWPGAADVWEPLGLSSARREDRWLIQRTWQLLLTSGASTDLHVTDAETGFFREITRQARDSSSTQQRDAAVNAFWRKLLRERSDALAPGGLAALPPYSADGVRIETRVEFDNLLDLAPAVAAHFRALTNGAPFRAIPNTGIDFAPFWEASLVRGHSNLQTGFRVTRKESQSWQVASCTYYVSDTYFMSFSLYELWPQDNGTLIWQIDFASAPFRSFTGGLDRVFAGKEMLKATAQAARLFRAEVEKNR